MKYQNLPIMPTEIHTRDRGRLPHWEGPNGCYFITYRLADSLPQEVLLEIERKRNSALAAVAAQRQLTEFERQRLQHLFTERIQEFLDSGAGACHLRDRRIAAIIAENLRHFDGIRYALHAFCVMPNHVHVVVSLAQGESLAGVVHSWKSFTAKEANRLLGCNGQFWQREYFDRLIRNLSDFEKTVAYVLDNPVRAGLQGWEFVQVHQAGEPPALRP